MKKLFYIPFLVLGWASGFSQDALTQKVSKISVDDKTEGYVLFSYQIPADGYYTFAVDGGLLPQKNTTIYYCEYQLQLKSGAKTYNQEVPNIASQAQDGNVCYFNTNAKNNAVSGVFTKGETVEMRLVLLKSDVNGEPHKKLDLTDNTLVSVRQMTPSVTSN